MSTPRCGQQSLLPGMRGALLRVFAAWEAPEPEGNPFGSAGFVCSGL